jgi:hypothetical protein
VGGQREPARPSLKHNYLIIKILPLSLTAMGRAPYARKYFNYILEVLDCHQGKTKVFAQVSIDVEHDIV